MGCVASNPHVQSLKGKVSNVNKLSKTTTGSSSSSVGTNSVKLELLAEKGVDPAADKWAAGTAGSASPEIKIRTALTAKRRGDIFDETWEDAASMSSPKTRENKAISQKSQVTVEFLRGALMENLLFRDLTEDQLNQIIMTLKKRKIKANTDVIIQGDKGDAFYVVDSGLFSVLVNGAKVSECRKGAMFGELALIYNSARAATVRCLEEAEVWELERKAFREIVASTVKRRRGEAVTLLRNVKLLESLKQEQVQSLADAVERVTFREGEKIIRKGEEGNLFYIVTKGEVHCVRAAEGGSGRKSAVDLTLGPGSYFGERALLKSSPRAADVNALTDVECLVLDREAFHNLLGPLKDIMDEYMTMRVLQSMPLFKDQNESDLRKIFKTLKEQSFKAGETVIKQGSQGTKLYIIMEGSVMVSKQESGFDKPVELNTLSVGDYVGEGSLLKDKPCAASVTVTSPTCTCLTMERSDFEALTQRRSTIKDGLRGVMDARDDQSNSKVKALRSAVEDSLQLSDLKMLRTLGTGTFGRVKIVECTKLKKTYALKILQKAQVVAYRQQANIMNEKNILLECDHPFILKLFRTFKDKSCLYLMLELVLGGELFSLLHLKGGSLKNEDARFYAACATSALSYLHDKTIVYRDLKPENLMIDIEGYVKVVDFGFAKHVPDKTFTLCGTPEYLSPEIVLGKGHNKAADNWAIGVLIFEMLTGASPFADHGNNDHMVICKNIVRGKIDFPKKFSEKAKDLVQRLLTRDAHLRLGSLKGGDDDIKNHAWFQKAIDFNELDRKRIEAPWKPPVKDNLDTSCFDEYDENDTPQTYNSRGSRWDEEF